MAKLGSGLSTSAYFHLINRDQTERYIAVITASNIRVFGLDGVEKTVAAPSGWGYLSGVTDPSAQLKAVTVADYTFIVNRTRTVASDLAIVAPTRPNEALVNIQQGNYGKTYRIAINGLIAASYSTPVGDNANQSPFIDTVYIAQQLVSGLIASGYTTGAGWTVARYGNAIHISKASGDFSITVEDGFNGNAARLAKGTVQRFADLPAFGPEGFAVEVQGSNGTELDNYWVVSKANGSGAQVIWREAPKPGTVIGLNAATMPHVLVREANGTFTFKPAAWDVRKCGDGIDVSPDPSFVGPRSRTSSSTATGWAFSPTRTASSAAPEASSTSTG